MCNYKILAHNEDGYIILCKGCNNYQLAFGTTAVTLDAEHFYNFCSETKKLSGSLCCNGFEKEKRIHMDLFCKTAVMILNYKEFKKLNELVSEALFNGQLENLLNNNQIRVPEN